MSDECPRETEYARIASKRAGAQLGQLSIVAGWQVIADLPDLLFDQMIVVEQPLGRRRDRFVALRRRHRRFVGPQQMVRVVSEPHRKRGASRSALRDRLCAGEAARMLCEPLFAEQLLAHRRGAVPWRRRRAAPQAV